MSSSLMECPAHASGYAHTPCITWSHQICRLSGSWLQEPASQSVSWLHVQEAVLRFDISLGRMAAFEMSPWCCCKDCSSLHNSVMQVWCHLHCTCHCFFSVMFRRKLHRILFLFVLHKNLYFFSVGLDPLVEWRQYQLKKCTRWFAPSVCNQTLVSPAKHIRRPAEPRLMWTNAIWVKVNIDKHTQCCRGVFAERRRYGT